LNEREASKLRVENLSVVYQTRRELVHAVTGVSFVLNNGSSLGLWGHSGCGKSTLMKALLGLPIDEPGWISGAAWFRGDRVAPRSEKYVRTGRDGTIYKNSMGFYHSHQQLLKPYLGAQWRSIFQEPIYSFDSWLPVGLQVRTVLDYYARGNSEQKKELVDEFASALSALDLQPNYIESHRNLQLSGGECQRIMLALSIVGKPQLLLADEPTTAMDHRTREQANELIANKIQTDKMSLLIASHNREELLALADSVVVLCKGMVVEYLPNERLRYASADSLHPYTRKLWFVIGDQDAQPLSGGGRFADDSLRGCPYFSECPHAEKDSKLAKMCREEKPPFFRTGKDHTVSCWLRRENGEAEPGSTKE
jgi:peptide/nickel transport system ATP-binding protein